MTQILVPTGDISNSGWTTAPLWSKIDDPDDTTPTDYITRANNSTGACRVGTLASTSGSIVDPADHTNHVLKFTGARSGSRTTTIVVTLYQGTTQIAQFSSNITTSYVTYTYTLSSAEAGNISNYSDLRIDINCTASGTGNAPRISSAWLEIPGFSSNTKSITADVGIAGAAGIDAGVEAVAGSVSVTINADVGAAGAAAKTVPVTIPGALISVLNHETGDLSQYSETQTGGGLLVVNSAAALGGSVFGLSMTLDGATNLYAKKTGLNSLTGKTRVRLYLDVNSLTMASGNEFVFFSGQNNADSPIFQIWLSNYDGSGYHLEADLYTDAGVSYGAYIAITDKPHRLEIYLQRATGPSANDGRIDFFIDDVWVDGQTGKDNYDVFASFGSVSPSNASLDAGTIGTIYLDEIVINATGLPVGSEWVTNVYPNAEPGAAQAAGIDAAFEAQGGAPVSVTINADIGGAAAAGINVAFQIAAGPTEESISLEIGLGLSAAAQGAVNSEISLNRIAALSALTGVSVYNAVSLAIFKGIAAASQVNVISTASLARWAGLAAQGGAAYTDAISLVISRGISGSGVTAFQAAIGLARSLGVGALAQARVFDQVALAKKAYLTDASQVNIQAAASLTRRAGVGAQGGVAYIDTINLARSLGIAIAGLPALQAAVSLGRSAGVSAQTQAQVFNQVTLAEWLEIFADGQQAGKIYEIINLGRSTGLSVATQARVFSPVSLAASYGLAAGSLARVYNAVSLSRKNYVSAASLLRLFVAVTLARKAYIQDQSQVIVPGEITLSRLDGITIRGQKAGIIRIWVLGNSCIIGLGPLGVQDHG